MSISSRIQLGNFVIQLELNFAMESNPDYPFGVNCHTFLRRSHQPSGRRSNLNKQPIPVSMTLCSELHGLRERVDGLTTTGLSNANSGFLQVSVCMKTLYDATYVCHSSQRVTIYGLCSLLYLINISAFWENVINN